VMPKILELVLSNGKCVLCDKQIGPATVIPGVFHQWPLCRTLTKSSSITG